MENTQTNNKDYVFMHCGHIYRIKIIFLSKLYNSFTSVYRTYQSKWTVKSREDLDVNITSVQTYI